MRHNFIVPSHDWLYQVQVVSELMVDIVTLCLEIRWQKLPVVAAWFHRQQAAVCEFNT